ncbi:IS701 family transposase [Amycolatopsis nalaikhensis]|uniref:IS701 family transposase n=1 Tax=Amycolatopsis nalaikhensis TaxID=715472 RepID=A0ABY8Y2L3_9PSEU|nr:IS701 family transposase [Amycolatopsis sp. 2-2]WIV61937.1 IS701 family transposase [Amycolatopsis sp. 2-2]WIV61960.1 IS701 family transposase [Amycolatopsis sp. 2-2]WIV62092.1 IS701 family transposase [Amycolatopsis sp. 2-2]WIV62136.1 IS701 family transposase [Amycolatopsis sp. 2-2]WIV62140.1 IS701 family transposase [Amycolatopsis sp. 2-2]
MFVRVGHRFARVESRRRAGRFVQGLLAGLVRVNCWTIAEAVGDTTPHGMQNLLSRASWDVDGVRDDLREVVVEQLGDQDAMLVIDETGDLKKGTESVGVQRQYTGTAGRIENSQMSVFLTYSTPAGHTFIDRELYLPESWAEDPRRRDRAGVPAGTRFTTKSRLALAMITRALDAGVRVGWVTGDEAYGKDAAGLRDPLEQRGQAYVLAVACDHRIPGPGRQSVRADERAAALPKRAWQKLSAGAGAKGRRYYLWARIRLHPAGTTGYHWILMRRNRRTGETAFYRCYSPRRVSLAKLARVAGRRWTIEETFQTGKELTGLDEHQVRTWTSWYRWTTLVMLAHAFLAIAAAHARHTKPHEGLIPLTRNEIRHLYAQLILKPARRVADILAWSTWRRRHQHHARQSHYQRRHENPAPDHELQLEY